MKVSDHLYYQKLDFVIPLPGGAEAQRSTYTVLLSYDRKCLIDSGVVATFEGVQQMLAEAGLTVQDLDMVINTHCHFDHIGGNYTLKQANPQLKFYAHPLARPFIEDLELQNRMRPVPSYNLLAGGPVTLDGVVDEGDTIDLGVPLQVLHTPGHSADSVSFYLPQDKVLIVGDAFPSVEDLPIYESLPALLQTLDKLARVDYDLLISGFDGLHRKVGDEDVIARARSYVELIDSIVRNTRRQNPDLTGRELSEKVLEEMGFGPGVPAFVYKSLAEHLAR